MSKFAERIKAKLHSTPAKQLLDKLTDGVNKQIGKINVPTIHTENAVDSKSIGLLAAVVVVLLLFGKKLINLFK